MAGGTAVGKGSREGTMEHPAIFEMRLAAHEAQVAKINRAGWKHTVADQGATVPAGRQEPRPVRKLAGLFALIARRDRAAEPTVAQVG